MASPPAGLSTPCPWRRSPSIQRGAVGKGWTTPRRPWPVARRIPEARLRTHCSRPALQSARDPAATHGSRCITVFRLQARNGVTPSCNADEDVRVPSRTACTTDQSAEEDVRVPSRTASAPDQNADEDVRVPSSLRRPIRRSVHQATRFLLQRNKLPNPVVHAHELVVIDPERPSDFLQEALFFDFEGTVHIRQPQQV